MPTITLNINGTAHKIEAGPDESLLSVLRNRLGMTGTKYGCGEGACGACTVLVQGQSTRSCLMPAAAAAAAGQKIVTVEGLSENGTLHAVQQAFLDEEAFQCGYCTSGMIMSACALLKSRPNPKEDEIIDHMNGNVCRCGTYPRILAAIRRAAAAQGGKKS